MLKHSARKAGSQPGTDKESHCFSSIPDVLYSTLLSALPQVLVIRIADNAANSVLAQVARNRGERGFAEVNGETALESQESRGYFRRREE